MQEQDTVKLQLEIEQRMHADAVRAWQSEHVKVMMLCEALRFARSTIITAITDEDGLDGGQGEIVLEYIRQTLSIHGGDNVDKWVHIPVNGDVRTVE